MKKDILGLEPNLKAYLNSSYSSQVWIRNPYTMNIYSETELTDSDIEDIIELLCEMALLDLFNVLSSRVPNFNKNVI